MKKKVHWDDLNFIYRSKYRKKLLDLLDNPKTPTQLKNETKIHFNLINRTLVELEKKGFVECLNHKQRMARFYKITNKGKKIRNEEIQNNLIKHFKNLKQL